MIVDSPKATGMNDDLWLSQANCTQPGIDPNWFWPDFGEHALTPGNVTAMRACMSCPVIPECRERQLDFHNVSSEPLQVIVGNEVQFPGRRARSRTWLCVACGCKVKATTVDGECLECAAGKKVRDE